ncbi:MAG: toll/interleukin-1 receptor domain-containing protein [Chloroflexi bacterium]|nr:toll/interleukin-1 receptor domain-containing protein [Chloroflexota bacterium]
MNAARIYSKHIIITILLLLSACSGAPSTESRPTAATLAPDMAATQNAQQTDTQTAPTAQQTNSVVIASTAPSDTGIDPEPSQVAGSGSADDPELVAQTDSIALPIIVRSLSGALLGSGTLRIYAPGSIQPGETFSVELEIVFLNRYITPTPFGQPTSVPIATVTHSPLPTNTPRSALYEEPELIDFYQLMGASLFCSPQSFTGCDSTRDTTQSRLISLSGSSWTWFLTASEGLNAAQDLRVELWSVSRITSDNTSRDEAETLWNHTFQITVGAATSADPANVVIGAEVLFMLALIGGGIAYVLWTRRQPKTTPAKKVRIFISYRRKASWSVARTLHDSLSARGADVFLDVDDINEGRFEDIIKHSIEKCTHFILILAPDTLQSEWVMKETLYAAEKDKRIIPVTIDGFDLYSNTLPPQLQFIKSHNAVSLTPEFFNAGLERIATFVGLTKTNSAE